MLRVRTVIGCVSMILTTALAAGAQTWTALGPSGAGETTRIYLAPSQPNTVFALVGNDQGGLYRTTDSGTTWTSIAPGLCDLHVNAIAVHPTAPTTIYAATSAGGVCKTTDGGTTWTGLVTGLPVDSNGYPRTIFDVAMDPQTPTTLYAGTAVGVYKTTDGGSNWALTGTSTAEIGTVAIAPSAPSTVYASIAGGVLRTTNGGGAWAAASTGISSSSDPGILVVDPTNANVVYLTSDNLYKTSNGGTAWAASNSGLGSPFFIGGVAIDPTNPNTLFVGAPGGCGLCKSTNAGASWSAVSSTGLPSGFGATNIVAALLIDPVTPARMYGGTPTGVYISTNSGANWTGINTNLNVSLIGGMALDGGSPASVVFATRALNDGANLSRLSGSTGAFTSITSPLTADDSGQISNIAVDPSDANIIYVLGGKANGQSCPQVYKTTNGGTSWTAMNSGTTIPASTCGQSLTLDPMTPGTLYLTATNNGGGSSFVNLYKTTNGATSWSAANSGLGTGGGYRVTVSRRNPATLYASNGSQVYRSTNGGGSWTGTATTLPTGSGSIFGSGSLVIDPSDDAIVYVATPAGVFGSTNSGTSWTAKRGGWPTRNSTFYSANALAIDPATPTTLYASSGTPIPGPSSNFQGLRAIGGAVFKSTDSGATWTVMSGPIAGAITDRILFDGTRAYAATNNGIFRLAPALPNMSIDKTALTFGAVSNGTAFSAQTATQTVRLVQSGSGTVTWTASSSAPWLVVSPASGSGSASLSVSVQFAQSLTTTQTGTITLTFTGAGNTAGPISVTLNTLTSGSATAPQGAFDTPSDGATGVTGSIPVTGWALDDTGVTRVRIMRDPVAGEPAGTLVFIGDAVLVDGARPDVQANFPNLPFASRAGFGYLMLTNFLPGLGNGTFKLYAIADDAEGHSTVLGSKTITCDNNSAITPFGGIDTPLQGETITTTSLNNFGWVLSPGSRKANGADGGTVQVVVDGVIGVSPGQWTARADLTALFPVANFSGVAHALGVATLDTTVLANGVHTISWLVTDNLGAAAGIGSRYFTVSNGGLTLDDPGRPEGLRYSSAAMIVAQGSSPASSIAGRRGYNFESVLQPYPIVNGRATIQSEELDRIELQVGAGARGYQLVHGGARPLPIGSHLDPETGTFTWQPGVAFLGAYDLVFAGPDGRKDVRVVLNPKGSNRVGLQTVVDLSDGEVVAGWAADLDSQVDSGVDTAHVWAYPLDGSDPIFVGAAEYGGARPDVAAIHGERFLKSGYGLRIRGLAPGTYDLAVFAYSTVKGGFGPAKVVRVRIR